MLTVRNSLSACQKWKALGFGDYEQSTGRKSREREKFLAEMKKGGDQLPGEQGGEQRGEPGNAGAGRHQGVHVGGVQPKRR
jgi:hypothetical protein